MKLRKAKPRRLGPPVNGYRALGRAKQRLAEELLARQIMNTPAWREREAHTELKVSGINAVRERAEIIATCLEPWWAWTAFMGAGILARMIERLG